MIDELCKKLLNNREIEELKTEALAISYNYDYATALAWIAVNKRHNNDLGKVGELLANTHFGWIRAKGDTDSMLQDRKIEIKTSVPPKGGYRIGQIKLNYDLNQSLFCQFFHVESQDMQFYWWPTIQEWLTGLEEWIRPDQGNDNNIVGMRAIPHGGKVWKALQPWRIDWNDIPR
tara:strand:- start:545 stop:1069 length:525 start_codon:yes stop_codon:yes gene_type:complete